MSYLCIVGFGTADRTPMNVKPLKHHLQMKATLNTILLSLLLTAGLTSCTQSDETKEIAEIQESIAKTDEALTYEKARAELDQRRAKSRERQKKNLEKMASTPEGRARMEKSLTKWKNSYVEGKYLVFNLTRDEAIKKGFTSEEYDHIIAMYTQINHKIDSCEEVSKAPNITATFHIDNFIDNFNSARNGTHEYYEYLKKYYNENPDVPALRVRK